MYLSPCLLLFVMHLPLVFMCRAYARKKGRNNVTVDDLIHVITPKGRGKRFFLHSLVSLHFKNTIWSMSSHAFFFYLRTMIGLGMEQMDNPQSIMFESFSSSFFLLRKKCSLLSSFTFLLCQSENLLLFVVAPDTLLSIYFACATASVPDSVKAELLQRIRSFLMSTSLR